MSLTVKFQDDTLANGPKADRLLVFENEGESHAPITLNELKQHLINLDGRAATIERDRELTQEKINLAESTLDFSDFVPEPEKETE